jgi:hypothetical protein
MCAVMIQGMALQAKRVARERNFTAWSICIWRPGHRALQDVESQAELTGLVLTLGRKASVNRSPLFEPPIQDDPPRACVSRSPR